MSKIYSTSLNDPAIFSKSFQQRRFDGPVKDPCDFIMKFGGEAFQRIIDKAEHIVDYKFRKLMAEVSGVGTSSAQPPASRRRVPRRPPAADAQHGHQLADRRGPDRVAETRPGKLGKS